MPIKQDESGGRFVQVEVSVPGTPEEAWYATATGPGIGSWFVPTTFEIDEQGRPVRVVSDFGPGMESVSTITEWDPPHRFRAESFDLGPDAPPILTDWIVEGCGEGGCTVRVVHRLVSRQDDWDQQLEAWESGWPDFFRMLRLYLVHFSGQPCAPLQLQAMSALPRAEAWSRLRDALGLAGVVEGEPLPPAAGAPLPRAGVERVGQAAHPEELLLRLEPPTPGIAHLFAMTMGEQTLISVRVFFYGEPAESTASEHEPRLRAWLEGLFPPEGTAGPDAAPDG